jgi:hypothetical protein
MRLVSFLIYGLLLVSEVFGHKFLCITNLAKERLLKFINTHFFFEFIKPEVDFVETCNNYDSNYESTTFNFVNIL